MNRNIALCIATIPGREHFLHRAMESVHAQTLQPYEVNIAVDDQREGAAATRNRAIGMSSFECDWLAFLDDDDELLPHHFEHLLEVAEETDADLVYPWYEAIRDGQVIPGPTLGQGEPFDRDLLIRHNCIPPEIIVQTRWVTAAGGFPTPNTPEWPHPDCEDWGLWRKLSVMGAKIVHTPEITWRWHFHDAHTRGLGNTPG